MAYKTCPDCGSRMFEHGCVNCNEHDYISMQDDFKPLPTNEPSSGEEVQQDKSADVLSIAQKMKAVQSAPEILNAVKLLRAAFDGCDLKTFIRFTYTFEDDKKFEIQFMPVLYTESYNNPEITKNQK